MDQKRAITRARAFCQAIGEAAEASATATYSGNPDDAERATSYYKPVWKVKVSDDRTVAVSSQKGFVCGYRNYTSDAVLLENADDTKPRLTAEEIKARALAICSIIGSNEELRYEAAKLTKSGNPAKPEQDHNYWMVDFNRIAHEILYHNQGLVMALAKSGRLLALGRNFKSSAAVSFVPNLSKERAASLAQDYLVKTLNLQAELDEIRLVYAVSDQQQPILAWELIFKFAHSHGSYTYEPMLLNDQTGQVIKDEWPEDLEEATP